MSPRHEIPELEKVLLPKFLGNTKTIENYSTKHLTAAGDNYGSIMLSVEITIKDSVSGANETLNVIAKLVPKNEFIQKAFQSRITFKKEIEMYQTIVPTLQDFQKEHGVVDVIDFFPKFFGARLGMSYDDNFDCNAVILLENLKIAGFENEDRIRGFDLVSAKLILRDLAQLHAVPIALKKQKPEVFKQKILPYLNRLQPITDLAAKMHDDLIKSIIKIASENEECAKYADRISEAVTSAFNYVLNRKAPKEPFATLVHEDFWVNNTMVKFAEDHTPIKNKMVDFQMTAYNSPAKDLTFFIFSSVENEVIVNNYDELVDEYYQTFIQTLKEFNVEVEEFNFEAFQAEIDETIKNDTMTQILFMLGPIFKDKDDALVVEELSEEVMLDMQASQAHKEKFWCVVKEFVKRKWL